MQNYLTLSNNLKKFIISLKEKKFREENKLFIVEGEKLCKELTRSEFQTEFIVLSNRATDEAKSIAKDFLKKKNTVYIARQQQFEQLCDTKSPQTILAIVRTKERSNSLSYPIIVLDSISDPGNLGTIIRTADWFGVKNIITAGYSVDKYNSKAIRSTMGSLFRCNIEYCCNLNDFLKQQSSDCEIYGASLTGRLNLLECNPSKPFILIFGNEANGISSEIKSLLDFEYRIEGKGGAESLNVAVSVGISLFHFSSYF